MRWKWVALAGVAWPAAAGCTIAQNTARNLVNEPLVVCTQRGIEHDLRKAAKAAWREVRADYPRRAFTAEFHDGFLDGYVDYLDRGGNCSLPATPPAKYTRHKKYFTEEGQCLVKEYFLGFKYGQEIAIATGRRQFLTVPVLLPQEPPQPPAFTIDPGAFNRLPPPMQVPVPPGVGARPAQPHAVPAANFPAPTPTSAGPLKFDVPAPREKPEPSRAASPPLPIPLPAYVGTSVNPPPVVEVPAVLVPPAVIPRLPAPPPEVPDLPAHVPTPPVWDDLPVVPPDHTPPPVVPPTHPQTREE